MQTHVAIVGSRHYPRPDLVERYNAALPPKTIVVSGGARGVDSVAEAAATAAGLETLIFRADWEKLGQLGYLVAFTLVVVVILVLVFLASRWRSIIARWILLVLVVTGSLVSVRSLMTWSGVPLVQASSIAQVVMQLVAVYLVFRPENRAWFSNKRANDQAVTGS